MQDKLYGRATIQNVVHKRKTSSRELACTTGLSSAPSVVRRHCESRFVGRLPVFGCQRSLPSSGVGVIVWPAGCVPSLVMPACGGNVARHTKSGLGDNHDVISPLNGKRSAVREPCVITRQIGQSAKFGDEVARCIGFSGTLRIGHTDSRYRSFQDR